MPDDRDQRLRWVAMCRALLDDDVEGLAALGATEAELWAIAEPLGYLAGLTPDGPQLLRRLLAAYRDEIELGIDDVDWTGALRHGDDETGA